MNKQTKYEALKQATSILRLAGFTLNHLTYCQLVMEKHNLFDEIEKENKQEEIDNQHMCGFSDFK